MFRNGDRKKAVSAELTLQNDRKLSGKVTIPAGSDLMRMLNGDAKFIEFETLSGVRSMIACSAIAEVQQTEIPKVQRLNAKLELDDSIDPYETLGLSKGASTDEVRAAYISLTKIYHPDRYASMDLPSEMLNYVEAMSRQINTAYAIIDAVFENRVA